MTPLSQAELNFTQRPGYEQIFLQIWNFQERLYVKCGSLVAVGFFKLIPIFLGTEEDGETAEGLPESGSECNWCNGMPCQGPPQSSCIFTSFLFSRICTS